MKPAMWITLTLLAIAIGCHWLDAAPPVLPKSSPPPAMPVVKSEQPPAVKPPADTGGKGILVIDGIGASMLVRDASGRAVLVSASSYFDQVIVLSAPSPTPTPTPVPTPIPPAPIVTVRAAKLRDAALKATADPKREETAAKLALLYSEIGKKIGTGELKGQEPIMFVCKMGCDKVTEYDPEDPTTKNRPAAWVEFRAQLTEEWADVQRFGGKDSDFALLLKDATDGLNASVTRMGAMDLRQLLEMIKVILDMILKLMPANPVLAGQVGRAGNL